MGIKKLIIENWKSYKGKFEIPIHDFCAIIGPNGSGKSNLMDAICFVLGVKTSNLRGKRMQDLVNRRRLRESEEGASSSVEIAFERKLESDPEGYTVINFKREVRGGGTCLYYLNGKSATWEEYNAKLKSINVLVKSKNFLVFQGDIEAVAAKSPKELTRVLEEVSGSADLIKEYKAALKEKQVSEETLSKHFDKRKAVLREKKEISEQKSEAENYKSVLEQLSEQKKKLLLSEYLQYAASKDKIEKTQNPKNESKELKTQLKNLKKDLKKCAEKKESHATQIDHLSEAISKQIEISQSAKIERSRTKEESQSLKAEISEIGAYLGRMEAEEKNGEKIQKSIEKELNKALCELTEISKESDIQFSQTRIAALTAQEKTEFDSAKAKVDEKTRESRNRLRAVSDKMDRINEILSPLAEQTAILTDKQKTATASKSDLEAELESHKESLTPATSALSALEARYAELNAKTSESQNSLSAARAQLKAKQTELQSLAFARHSSERARRRMAALDALKTAFPGAVHGLVADLVRPVARKYAAAVAAALGRRRLDAIVVRSREAAIGCIALLKERRLGEATFIPLEGCSGSALETGLRRMGKGVRLAVDLVAHSREHRGLAIQLLGNTAVTETLEEARRVAFGRGGGRRFKAVTWGGVVISKNGNMTGGSVIEMNSIAEKFDEARGAALETEIATLKNKIEEFQLNFDDEETKTELAEDRAKAEKKIETLKTEISINERLLSENDSEIRKIQVELAKIEDKKKPILREKLELKTQLKSIEEEIHRCFVEEFRNFCLKRRIENIKEFVESVEGAEENREHKRLRADDKVNKLRQKLAFQKSKTLREDIEDKQNHLKDLSKRLKNATQTLSKLRSGNKSTNDKIKNLRFEKEGLEKRSLKNAKDAEDLKKEAGEKSSAVFKAMQTESKAAAALENLENMKNDIKIKAELEDIDIEQLADEHLQKPRAKTKDPRKAEEKCKNEILRLEKEASEMCPNMRSFEQFKKAEERALEVNKEFHSVKKECQNHIRKFKEVEKKRIDLFKAAFNHVEREIASVYKKLTRSEKHPLGGNAYLTLENSDFQPFNHGTIYGAMPPSKRFRDIESLSGGEKSIAALALLFAVHSFRPAPFFVLDEIDAALDAQNVERVVRFLGEKTKKENLQCIVISLKESFYHNANQLVGVYKDTKTRSSGVLTLDLGKRFGALSAKEKSDEIDDGEEMGSAISQRGESVGLSVSSFEIDEN